MLITTQCTNIVITTHVCQSCNILGVCQALDYYNKPSGCMSWYIIMLLAISPYLVHVQPLEMVVMLGSQSQTCAKLQITTLSPTNDQVSVCYICLKILVKLNSSVGIFFLTLNFSFTCSDICTK